METVLLQCLKVFVCRIMDVTLGTVRMVLTVKDKTLAASAFGFVEVFIWFLVVRDALNSSGDGVLIAVAYAGGYATGTFVGGRLSHKFIKGNMTVNIVLSGCGRELLSELHDKGFGATVVDVMGSEPDSEPRKMLICEIVSTRLDELKRIVRKNDPSAFFMVQETKVVMGGFVK